MKKLQLLTNDTGLKSNSLKRIAKALEDQLGYKVWRTTTVRTNKVQLQYGDPLNKLEQYKKFQSMGLSSLEFTQDKSQVNNWLSNGCTVFARKLLNSSCGKGIVVIEPGDSVPDAPVYTKYKKKKQEFRVHVLNKQHVVAIVEKRLKSNWTGPTDHKIRNLANGFVFCQEVNIGPQLTQRLWQLALEASKVTSSSFVGVDIGFNHHNDDLFVIEVNSAPGIEGSNVNAYVSKILENHENQ